MFGVLPSCFNAGDLGRCIGLMLMYSRFSSCLITTPCQEKGVTLISTVTLASLDRFFKIIFIPLGTGVKASPYLGTNDFTLS